jgi:hypothetical protein
MVLAGPDIVEAELLGEHRLFEVVAVKRGQRAQTARQIADPRGEDDTHPISSPGTQAGRSFILAMRGEAHAWHLPAQRKLAAILAVDIAFSANDGSRR